MEVKYLTRKQYASLAASVELVRSLTRLPKITGEPSDITGSPGRSGDDSSRCVSAVLS